MADIELASRSDFGDLQQGRLHRPNPYRSECEDHFTLDHGMGDDSISYGCLDNGGSEDEKVWFESDCCGGSDYSGGSVAASNYRVIIAECVRLDEEMGREMHGPTFWQTFYGGHGTFAIAFHVDKTPRKIFDMLAALEDYPVLDDSDLSELEHEREQEAWENWACREYAQELEKRFNGDCDGVDQDKLHEHFHAACELANEYWEHTSEGPYILLERVAAAAAEPPEGFVPLAEESEAS